MIFEDFSLIKILGFRAFPIMLKDSYIPGHFPSTSSPNACYVGVVDMIKHYVLLPY